MKMKNKNLKEKILLIILALLMIPLISAQNDPGHDTLYIEEQGDSDLNGTLNITQNLTVNGGRIRQPGGLTLYGDDSTPAPGVNYISGTSGNNIYIDGQGNVYIKFLSGGDMVYIGGSTATDLNISGALYFGGDNKLYTSAAAGAASSDLYWGDKLLCNASESNCGWASNVTGGVGDITAVNTNDKWLSGGAASGVVSLTFNESELNDTIDAKVGSSSNNYTMSIGFSTAGATETLNLKRYGMSNLTASFTDTDTTIGNCSVAQSCTGVLYDTNFTQLHQFGDCAAGTYVQNTTATGVECGTPSPATGGGWTDLGTTINLTTPSDNVSAKTLYIDNTNSAVGIGTVTPNAMLHINGSSNQFRISYDASNYGNISVNSAGNMTIRATGHVIIDLS